MAQPKQWYAPKPEITHDLGGAPVCKKILILDDEEDFVEILREFLTPQNYHIVSVSNGAAGIREILASDFDVILCDMMMPNLPGDMFYLAVQRSRPHLIRRFIFMTGHHGNPRIDDFIRNVGGLMLWKPFQLYQLMEAIQVVERKQSRSS